jgi:Flp pilus assembly protein TadB
VPEALAAATAASATSNAVPAELPGRSQPGGLARLAGRIITALLALAVMIAGFMFSMVLLVAGLVVGGAVFLWIWWKMRRAVRRMAQDAPSVADGMPGSSGRRGAGQVIEGEVLSGEWKEPRDPGSPAR